MKIIFGLGAAALIALLAFAFSTLPNPAASGGVTPLAAPSSAGSGESNLFTAPDGTVYLTWCQPGLRTGERALYLSSLAAGTRTWSTPRLIVSSPLLMENWADFASITVDGRGAITAQWFQNSENEGHGYSGWVSRSADHGQTWSTPAPLGHEFVSLATLDDGRVLSVWLESVQPSGGAHAHGAASMQLRSRLLAADGTTLREWLIDPDVCTCCQTSLAVLPGDDVLVFYRGHTPDEIRDHRLARFTGDGWTAPQTLHDDHWKIAACPVNGPAADARGTHTAVAWYTAADGIARVQVKFSGDAGHGFGPAIPVDLGHPLGRIDLVMLPDASALVTWLEVGHGKNAAGLYARRIFSDGTVSAARLLVQTSQSRASGFPRLACQPDRAAEVVLTWTEESAGKTRVRTALVSVPQDRGTAPASTPHRLARAQPREMCGATLPDNLSFASHP